MHTVAVRLGEKSCLVSFFLRENGNHSHEITFVFAYRRISPAILLSFFFPAEKISSHCHHKVV